MTRRVRFMAIAAVTVFLTQVGTAPNANAVLPVEDVTNLAQNMKTAIQTLKALELHYEQIRYLSSLRKGNYIRALTRDAVIGGSCSTAYVPWARVTNVISHNLDELYRLASTRPDFTGCISDWPQNLRDQYRHTSGLELSSVNGLNTLATLKQNIVAGEVQRTFAQNDALNVSRTGRSWTSLAQKTSNATADAAALLVEIERAQAATLEQFLVQNQIAHDAAMARLNLEAARRDAIRDEQLALIFNPNWRR